MKLIDAAFVRAAAQAVDADERVIAEVVRYMRPKTYRQNLESAEIAALLYDFGVQVRD